MTQISFGVFLAFFCFFCCVMRREPRSLWSGVSFFLMMLGLGGFVLCAAAEYAALLPGWAYGLLLALAMLAALLVLAFPLLLLGMFVIEGVKVVRHEGLRPANLLSLGFAVLWFGFLFVWPALGSWAWGPLGRALYFLLSFSAVYFLALMAMYVLSALLNLVHLRQNRRLDYIVVLGAGLDGDRLTPLLASRVDRGAALLARNPEARLILSGGQGPGEDLPESDAMGAYAAQRGVSPQRMLLERRSATTEENLRFSRAMMGEERPRVAVVTTAYHVFRALILAKKLGLPCVGFGAKTKWYFTLNAELREFAGYLKLAWRRHAAVLGALSVLVLLAALL